MSGGIKLDEWGELRVVRGSGLLRTGISRAGGWRFGSDGGALRQEFSTTSPATSVSRKSRPWKR